MQKRRSFMKTISMAGVMASVHAKVKAKAQAKRPNLVFIFPDQYRKQAMGFMNEDPVITPNLDKFAAESIVFTHAVSNRPVCTPYRASLLTGKYPFKHGLVTNCSSNNPGLELKKDEILISDILSSAGYSCGYIGKWHLDSPHAPYINKKRVGGKSIEWDEYCPLDRRHGFSYWHAHGSFNSHMNMHYWINDAARDEMTIYKNKWSPDVESDRACEFIENKDGQFRKDNAPFCLFVSMNPPHPPYHIYPKNLLRPYKNIPREKLFYRKNTEKINPKEMKAWEKRIKDYFSMVTGVDAAFGKIIDSLKKQDLDKDTIVVFSSDHGEMMGSHGLKGKVVWYEESFGIPLIIRWPENLKPGKDPLLFSVPDTMPTLLTLMGMGNKIPKDVQGVSHAEYMRTGKGKTPTSALYYGIINKEPAPRGLKTHRYTYVEDMKDNGKKEVILFDNENDPYQLKNVALKNPDVAGKLHKELINWLQKTEDPHTSKFI